MPLNYNICFSAFFVRSAFLLRSRSLKVEFVQTIPDHKCICPDFGALQKIFSIFKAKA